VSPKQASESNLRGFSIFGAMAGIHRDTRDIIGNRDRKELDFYRLSMDPKRGKLERPETGLEKFLMRYGKDYLNGLQHGRN
jgi:hypothetical protein